MAIGAAIADQAGQVLARGRNQVVDTDRAFHPLRHAELAVLTAFDYTRYDPPFDYILYTTLEPCPLCMGAFYMSGLRKIRYAACDPHAGSINLLGTTPYLQRKPIRVIHPQQDILEILLLGLVIAPMLAGGATEQHPVLNAYRHHLPAALHFGQRLANSHLLDDLRQQSCNADEMIHQLERLYNH